MSNRSFFFAVIGVVGFAVLAFGLLGTAFEIIYLETGRSLVNYGGGIGFIGLVASTITFRNQTH